MKYSPGISNFFEEISSLSHSVVFLYFFALFTFSSVKLLNRVRLLGFPGGSNGKNMTAMQETQVQSLGQEDPLEQGNATHSSILAWRIP